MTEPPSIDPQQSDASNSGGLSRVFVVDDESVIASTLASILKLNGYDVRHFVDPLEALDVPAEEGPELLISDVVMPGLSGVDLAIRMKESVRPARFYFSLVRPKSPTSFRRLARRDISFLCCKSQVTRRNFSLKSTNWLLTSKCHIQTTG